MSSATVEIERKWLIDGFPDLPEERCLHTEQAYLSFDPTVRIRKHAEEGKPPFYVLTIKGEGTLQRTEVETPLTEEQYSALLALAKGEPVKKEYHAYRLPGGEVLECSAVDPGEPGSFYYAEVEFTSVEQAGQFIPPVFLGREVTEDSAFTMSNYCKRKAGIQ